MQSYVGKVVAVTEKRVTVWFEYQKRKVILSHGSVTRVPAP
jgi:hypothetical protein